MPEKFNTYCPACGQVTSLDAAAAKSTSHGRTAHQCRKCGVRWTLHSAHEASTVAVIGPHIQEKRTDLTADSAHAAGIPQDHGESSVPRTNCRLALLSSREREVMDLVVAGRTNNQTAKALGISASSIEKHRAKSMRKLQAKSLVDVIRMYMNATAEPPSIAKSRRAEPHSA